MTNPPEVLLRTRLFSVVRHTRPSPRGTIVRESIQHPGAVTIVPMVTGDEVCLIRNHRITVDETLIELPAGTLDPGEDPHQTALRELAEETGFVCQSLRKLHEFYTSPGILNERMVLFVATGLTAGRAALEPGEEIETFVVPWQVALSMVDEGRIRDAKSLVGLLYYERLRQRGQG